MTDIHTTAKPIPASNKMFSFNFSGVINITKTEYGATRIIQYGLKGTSPRNPKKTTNGKYIANRDFSSKFTVCFAYAKMQTPTISKTKSGITKPSYCQLIPVA